MTRFGSDRMEDRLQLQDLLRFMNASEVIPAYISDIENLSIFARRYTIRPLEGSALPVFEPGSNIEVSVPAREGDKPTPYSITSAADRFDSYQIIVVNNSSNSSGKNYWLNSCAYVDDRVEISAPRQGLVFRDKDDAAYFIAGGSGIAAFLSHLNSVKLSDKNYQIDHVVRDEEGSFQYLDQEIINSLEFNTLVTSVEENFEIRKILAGKDLSRPLYIAGSGRFISEVIDKALDMGWSIDDLRWDNYALPDNEVRSVESAV